jgi:hypothetical protein
MFLEKSSFAVDRAIFSWFQESRRVLVETPLTKEVLLEEHECAVVWNAEASWKDSNSSRENDSLLLVWCLKLLLPGTGMHSGEQPHSKIQWIIKARC